MTPRFPAGCLFLVPLPPPAGCVLSDSAFCHDRNALFCAAANVVTTKAVLLRRAWNVASGREELKS